MKIDTSGWTPVGESSNSRYFVVAPGVLAALPNEGAKDDHDSALSNVAFQNDFFRREGRKGVIVVFVDLMVSQDKGARRVYQSGPDPAIILGTALVGGSLLGRAIGSFFLGIAKAQIPVKMFANLDAALAWAAELHRAADAPRPSTR